MDLPLCHAHRQRAAPVDIESDQTICLYLLPDYITANKGANCVETSLRIYVMSPRLDSPIMQGFTELSVIAGSEDPPEWIVLSDQNESAAAGWLTACSWCKKAKIDG
jgi:hypothetical protein